MVRSRVAWLVLLLSLPSYARQSTEEDDLAEMVARVLRATDAPEKQVELGLACLEKLETAPDHDAERDVRLALGVTFVTLERYPAAQEHLTVAQQLARETGDLYDLAHCLWLQSIAAFHLGQFEEGVEFASEGVVVAESIDQLDILWRSANLLGLIHERQGAYDAALEAFSRGLEAAQQSNDRDGVGTLIGNIGIAQMNLGEYELARDQFGQAHDIQLELGDQLGLATTLANLGDVHILQGELEAAEEYHLEALQLRQEAGSEQELSLSYQSLGTIAHDRGDHAEALDYFTQALEIRERLSLGPERAATLAAMSLVYAALDQKEDALALAQQGLDITDQLDMKGRRMQILESLATVYEKQGALASALDTYHEANELEREQRSLETQQRFARLQAQFEAEQREQEIALLTKQRELQDSALKRQRLVQIVSWVGSLSIALVAAAGWWAWARMRRTHRAFAAAKSDLSAASVRIQHLEGVLPICAHCKSIRDEGGEWQALEAYVSGHSEAKLSHGICPECVDRHYSSA